jgi:hypothetical protein
MMTQVSTFILREKVNFNSVQCLQNKFKITERSFKATILISLPLVEAHNLGSNYI